MTDKEQMAEYTPEEDAGTDDGYYCTEGSQDIDLSQFQTPFSKEELINQYSLRNTGYKAELTDMIDQSDLYESAKRAFKDTVNNFFSQTWRLSNLERRHSTFMNKSSTSNSDEVKGAILALKLTLLKNTAAMCRSDRDSPDYLVLISNITSHFRAFISQAKNGKERAYQARTIIKQESINKTITEREQPKETKERKRIW